MEVAGTRFLFDGKRLHDNETPESIGIKDGDSIEVCSELQGGGRGRKRKTNIAGNKVKILQLLDDDDVLEECEQGKKKKRKMSNKDSSEKSPISVEEEMNTILLDKEYNRHFQENPNKKPRQELEESNDKIEDLDFGQVQPLERCFDQVDELDSENDKSECDIHNKSVEEGFLNETIEDTILKTPQKCKELFSKFSLKTPSPHLKLGKVKENEMRSFSVAVHLWAEDNYGGTKILQQRRLLRKDFQEIINTGTKYNLLKSRSADQYKSLWRNTFGSKEPFRGDPKSGYENKMKLHSPSKAHCPFQHCNSGILKPVNPLEVDLMLMTPERSKERLCVKGLSSKNLFNTSESGSTVSLHEDGKLMKNMISPEEYVGSNKQKTAKFVLTCKQEGCAREFISTFGLQKHVRKDHSDLNFNKGEERCNICGKTFFYLDKHIKAVHFSMVMEEICEVCGKSMKKGMKKHRGLCISCPFCGKEEKKRLRLLKHISHCKQIRKRSKELCEPLDLSSPVKVRSIPKHSEKLLGPSQANSNPLKHTQTDTKLLRPTQSHEDPFQTNQTNLKLLKPTETKCHHWEVNKTIQESQQNSKETTTKEVNRMIHSEDKSNLLRPRKRYPFDKDIDEDYMSEIEDGDEKDFTKLRRENKDMIELRLRDIDKLVNNTKAGDEVVVGMFRSFMEVISNGRKEEDESKQNVQPSTVGLYTRAIQNDFLPVLHDLFQPFDSRWLLDCTTEKHCTFEGDDRMLVSPCEPIYLTPKILRKTIAKYDGMESGHQRSILVAAISQFMKFIELEFSEKLSVWGREPLDKVISYHNAVKCFIEGKKIWKTCNRDRRRQLKKNQILKDIENPNHESEKLESYTKYLKSHERLENIKKVVKFAKKKSRKPNNAEFTQCGNIVMGEVVIQTGCRPVVVYRMPVGGYSSMEPGFNPYVVSKNDCVLEEEENDMKLYRRLNPNLPPKHLACKHQIENKSAICPEDCEDKCEPDGFNIYVTWDKTRDTNGPSYLHLPKSTKDLLGLYDIIKTKYFEGTTLQKDPDWLNNKNTSFFLNTSGSAFDRLNLKHISEAMKLDVTAYDFRRIVVTWAVSHESEEIRAAESETLRHGNKVAYNHYVQNKQLRPQKLIQTFVEEEGVIPEEIREEIKKAENKAKTETSEIEQTRHKIHHESMIKEKDRAHKLRMENKPLGQKHRILEKDKTALKSVIEELAGETYHSIVKTGSAQQWRQFILRLLCTASGLQGEELRSLWENIYKGDLKFGVRDVRLKAKEKNWPRQKSVHFLQSHDRNTFIAGTIFKALKYDIKLEAKTRSLQLIN